MNTTAFITYSEMEIKNGLVQYDFYLKNFMHFYNYKYGKCNFDTQYISFKDIKIVNTTIEEKDQYLYSELIVNGNILYFTGKNSQLPSSGLAHSSYNEVIVRVYCLNECPNLNLTFSSEYEIRNNQNKFLAGWNLNYEKGSLEMSNFSKPKINFHISNNLLLEKRKSFKVFHGYI